MVFEMYLLAFEGTVILFSLLLLLFDLELEPFPLDLGSINGDETLLVPSNVMAVNGALVAAALDSDTFTTTFFSILHFF